MFDIEHDNKQRLPKKCRVREVKAIFRKDLKKAIDHKKNFQLMLLDDESGFVYHREFHDVVLGKVSRDQYGNFPIMGLDIYIVGDDVEYD